MKLTAIVLAVLTTSVFGLDLTELKATATRIEGEGGEFRYRVDYETKYRAKLGVRKGAILGQSIVRFYDGKKHLGSYFVWGGGDTELPAAITSHLETKPDSFTHVRITERFYDVNWRDGRWSKEEQSKWYAQTWHLFNSSSSFSSAKDGGYYLCKKIEDIPLMEGYLKGCGFTVFSVLSHTFTLSNTITPPIKDRGDDGADQPAAAVELKPE